MDWKGGHKEKCEPVSVQQAVVTCLSERGRKQCETDIKRDGFHVLYHSTGPCCVVHDAQTNSLHESLSDQDVVFSNAVYAQRAEEGADGSASFAIPKADRKKIPQTTLAKMGLR
eukprot:COSAG04_NODE_2728_length_3669_cov_5.478503_2_plen_114_part_00